MDTGVSVVKAWGWGMCGMEDDDWKKSISTIKINLEKS